MELATQQIQTERDVQVFNSHLNTAKITLIV